MIPVTRLDGRRKYFFTFYVMQGYSLITVRTVTIRHYTVDNARHLAKNHVMAGEYLSSYYQVSLKG